MATEQQQSPASPTQAPARGGLLPARSRGPRRQRQVHHLALALHAPRPLPKRAGRRCRHRHHSGRGDLQRQAAQARRQKGRCPSHHHRRSRRCLHGKPHRRPVPHSSADGLGIDREAQPARMHHRVRHLRSLRHPHQDRAGAAVAAVSHRVNYRIRPSLQHAPKPQSRLVAGGAAKPQTQSP